MFRFILALAAVALLLFASVNTSEAGGRGGGIRGRGGVGFSINVGRRDFDDDVFVVDQFGNVRRLDDDRFFVDDFGRVRRARGYDDFDVRFNVRGSRRHFDDDFFVDDFGRVRRVSRRSRIVVLDDGFHGYGGSVRSRAFCD